MTVYNFYNPIYHNKQIRGTLTSLTDFSVLNNIKIHNCCTDLQNFIPLIRKNNNFGLDEYKLNRPDLEDDIIVTSSRILIDSTKEPRINLKCKTLVLLDSADIYFGNLGVYPNIGLILQHNPNIKFDKLILLANPSNKDIMYPKYDYIEYYHKFNIERIKKLNMSKEMYKYSRINKEYIRCYNWYFENIGKNLLERFIMGVPIEYSPDGKKINDGLHYYLKLLGIDDNISQVLTNIDTSILTRSDKGLINDIRSSTK